MQVVINLEQHVYCIVNLKKISKAMFIISHICKLVFKFRKLKISIITSSLIALPKKK